MLHVRLAALAIATVAFASAQAQAPGVTATSILIGQSVPLTGANAELGKDIRNGALAYFTQGQRRRRRARPQDRAGLARRRATWCSAPSENTQKLVEEQKRVRAVRLRQRDAVAPGAADRREAQRAVPVAVHRRRPDARVRQARLQHARELRRRAGEDRRALRAARREALLDRLLRRRGRPREPGGGGPRAEEAQLRDRVGGGVEGPRQARHRGRREGGRQGPARRGDPDHAVQGDRRTSSSSRRSRAFGAQMASNSFPARARSPRSSATRAPAWWSPPWCRRPPSARCRSSPEYRAAIEKQLGKKELLVHLARVLHRRQGGGRGDAPRRAEADARRLHAGARRHGGLRRRRLRRRLLAEQPQRQLVRRADRDRRGQQFNY